MSVCLTNAVAVKKLSTPNTFLLIVDKSFVSGRFGYMPFAPAIGAAIVIEYRVCSDVRDIVDVLRWEAYSGDVPMSFRLLSKSTEELKVFFHPPMPTCTAVFTEPQRKMKKRGMMFRPSRIAIIKFRADFYTCGCVRYKTIPLSSPAVFNDIIGVVEDKKGVLQKKYIGKLRATVKLSNVRTGHKWELCCVNEYLQQPTDLYEVYSRGIVGAVNQKGNLSYITSREFPRDVRFKSGNLDVDWVKGLLGREVTFFARQQNGHIYHVTGSVEPLTRSIIPIVNNGFFSLVVKVEHIGCKDEHGVGIVWSGKLEFIRDPFKLIRGFEYGIYEVQCIRQYKHDQFPKWRIVKVLRMIYSYKTQKERTCARHSEVSYKSSVYSKSLTNDQGKPTSIYEGVYEIEESQSSDKASRFRIIPRSSLRTRFEDLST